MKTPEFFHELPAAVQRQFVGILAQIILRNINKDEVLPSCDVEISAFWAGCGYSMNVPDEFLSFDFYDSFFTLDLAVDLERMEREMFSKSCDYEDEITEEVPYFEYEPLNA